MIDSTNKLMTPSEILEVIPELESKFGWTNKHLGIFFKSKLLFGHYDTGNRVAMINIKSVNQLVEFTNDMLDNQKVQITHAEK